MRIEGRITSRPTTYLVNGWPQNVWMPLNDKVERLFCETLSGVFPYCVFLLSFITSSFSLLIDARDSHIFLMVHYRSANIRKPDHKCNDLLPLENSFLHNMEKLCTHFSRIRDGGGAGSPRPSPSHR